MQVEVFFLGEPRIHIDKEEKVLGKNKLEALLWYLLFQEEMGRTEVSSVFWPGIDPARAKSSLRNSLYEIRQILGVDLFSASTRDRIVLSRDVILLKDVDQLVDPPSTGDVPEYGSAVFMQNRELKNNPAYESWLFSMRDAYQRILAENLRSNLHVAIAAGRGPDVSRLAREILEIDPYDEVTLRELMKYYADHGQYNEALACFVKMKQTLERDLAVDPEHETLQLADFIHQRKQPSETSPGAADQTSGHLITLTEKLREFIDGTGRHLLVCGDPGSGRGDLIRSFLQTARQDACVIRLDLPNRQVPEGFLMKWARSFQGRDQEDFRKLLVHLPGEMLICVIENLEFIDPQSLVYLADFLSQRQDRVFFILEVTWEFLRGSEMLRYLMHHDALFQFKMPLPDRDELAQHLQARGLGPASPGSPAALRSARLTENCGGGSSFAAQGQMREEELNAIFAYSGGNPLLAEEYLVGGGRLEGLFLRLTADLDPAGKKLLEDCSVYPEGFTPAMAGAHARDQAEGMILLRSLVSRGLIIESGEVLQIKYPPLRQWLYDGLPQFYRIHLHELAAAGTQLPRTSRRKEARMKAWHWKMAGNQEMYLTHQLTLLELTLNFYDQMYPSDLEADDLPDHLFQQRHEQYELLEAVAGEVEAFARSRPGSESARMLLITGYLRGRRMIAGGRQDEGAQLIREVIRQARKAGDREYLLKGTIELIHFGIQKDDRKIMGEHLRKANVLIRKMEWGGDERNRAEVLRLSGLFEFNSGRYEEALARLTQADEILREPGYAGTGFLARAGTLNYIGRTREAMGDPQGADEAFRASLALVEGRLHKCLDILYAEYGRFLWGQGRSAEAGRILGLALQEYQILGTHWKRPATEAILGLISLENKDYKAARSHLVNAQIYHRADRRRGEETLIEQLAGAVRAHRSRVK